MEEQATGLMEARKQKKEIGRGRIPTILFEDTPPMTTRPQHFKDSTTSQ
jgi:hypothetical protein